MKQKTKTKAPNIHIPRLTKRAMFVGCSHGAYANRDSLKAVLDFVIEYRPHHRVHLGDAWDLAAFRANARGTPDEAESHAADDVGAAMFLVQYEPTLFFFGNHEDRLHYLRKSGSEIVALAAKAALDGIEKLCDSLKCKIVPYDGVASKNSWRLFGDTLAGHGFLFGENSTRDHVEMLGMPVIHAHDHRAKMQPGRVVGAPMGYSVGTLANIPAMYYAKSRRSTASWSGAIVYGEYGDGKSKWALKPLHNSERSEWTSVS